MKLYDKELSSFMEEGRQISLFSIALPKHLELLLSYAITTVSTLILSGYSETATAAVGVANTFFLLCLQLTHMISLGVSIVMSAELGRKNRERAGRIAGTGFFLAILICVIFLLLSCFATEHIIKSFSLDAQTHPIAVSYLRIRLATTIIPVLQSYISTLLICNGFAIISTATNIASAIANALLCFFFLYSPSVPAFFSGTDGVAYAAVLSQVLPLIASILFLWRLRCPFRFRFCLPEVTRILRIGCPAGMTTFSFSLASFLTTGFISGLGNAAINAKTYAQTIMQFTPFSLAFGQATGVLVGRLRGQKDFLRIRALYRQNLRFTTLGNLLLSLIAFVLHRPLLSLFTTDETTLLLGGTILGIDVLLEVARAINHISENTLNANGDTVCCFLTSVLCCWGCSVLLGYIFAVTLGWGLTGLWIAYTANEAFKAIAYIIRFKSGRWQSKRI
ncbi:MAG: MATE family efflux transporter [Clostridia bacterium]|nr:MATE family efflux transporter [Clostridia bacterium]